MRFHAHALAAGLLLAASSVAQTPNTYYVPNNNAGTGIPNLIPFGDTSPTDPSWSNQKYQTLVTATQLGGTARPLVELGFASVATGLRRFATLRIQMAHTTATTLGTNFAANLGGSPSTVLDATSYEWSNRPFAWNRIGLTSSFAFDGTSNVVVDIQVTGAGMPNASAVPGFLRETSVPRLFAFGWSGGPPADGVADLNGLKIECGMAGLVDFSLFGHGCPGSNSLVPALGYTVTGTSGRLGQNMVMTLANAFTALPPEPTGSVLFTGFSNRLAFSGAVPLPVALDGAGAPGCSLFVDPLQTTFSPVSPTGTATLTQPIPNNPALLGARVFHQFLVIDLIANPLGLTFTNYGRVILGS
jgi:hypothetical protein